MGTFNPRFAPVGDDRVVEKCQRCVGSAEGREVATAACHTCQQALCRDCELAHGLTTDTKSHLVTKIEESRHRSGQEHLIMAYIGDIIGPRVSGLSPSWTSGPAEFGPTGRRRGRGNFFSSLSTIIKFRRKTSLDAYL